MSAQAAHEPSMEDILASIRKIISEDGNEPKSNEPKPQDTRSVEPSAIAPAVSTPSDIATSDAVNKNADMTPNSVSASADNRGNIPPTRTHSEPFSIDTPSATVSSPAPIVERRESFDEPANPLASSIPPLDRPTPKPAMPMSGNVDVPGFIEKKPTSEKAGSSPDISPDISSVFRGTASARSTQAEFSPQPAVAETEDMAHNRQETEIRTAQQAETPVFQNSETMATPRSDSPALLSPETVERREESERRNHPLRRGADREKEEFSKALMSPQTDDAVGSAFEQLKNSAMDNLDGKVDALLRPMLREWLDNNLPSMVERLVRDEIERVSRGD